MVTRMTARTNFLLTGGPPDGWKARLSSTRFAVLEHVEATGSTNADLVARAGDADDGTVLVTDHQTAGRGRLGRTWDAPPGTNLLVSVLLRPDWPPENHPLVTPALSALAIFTFLGNWTAFFWPLIVTTSKELYTLPIGLTSFAVEQQVQWEKIMTGAALATIPTLVVFLLLQRFIVRGVMLAGLKG